MPRNVSMRKVAELSGVSVSAVSQILNNREINFCSEETKQRIRRVAQELGYRQNFGYQLLHGKETQTVAVLIAIPSMLEEEHFKDLTIKLLQCFEEKGYSAYCACLSPDEAGTFKMVENLVFRGVEHIAFIGAPFGVQRILQMLEANNVSAIGMKDIFPRYISAAAHLGGLEIFRHFRNRIGERFQLVCRSSDLSPDNARIQALQMLYPELSLEDIYRKFTFVHTECDVDGKLDFFERGYRNGRRAMADLLDRMPELGGAVFMNDAAAQGAASLLLDQPDRRRILIAGYNNDNSIRHYPYPISSLQMNIQRVARLIAEYAVNNAPCRIEVPPLVFIRGEQEKGSSG